MKIVISAIVGITILESIALFKGVDNGILLNTAIVAVTGLAAYHLKHFKSNK